MTGPARAILTRLLRGIEGGSLTIVEPGRTRRFGAPDEALRVTVTFHDRGVWRSLLRGSTGLGATYMDGRWDADDVTALVRLAARNAAKIDRLRRRFAVVVRPVQRLRGGRVNTPRRSRRQIAAHYDLGNDLFAAMLDERMLYSAGIFATPHTSLEDAQLAKLDAICTKLDLRPDDHLLEIGTGWGGFAVWASTQYGCRVTTTTISEAQYRHARDWVRRIGDAGSRITVLREDYRNLRGRFDKIVSIEMFEAVGLKHYDDYFGAVDRLLEVDGVMLLQTITVDEQWFPRYRETPDWIEKHIFPGGELASVGEILKSLGRATHMSMHHAENIGTHYARTLRAWRDRFHARIDEVRALGFDERFIRMWDLYLAYCEAAFLERHAGDFQLVLTKNNSARTLFNEVRAEREAGASAVA